MKERKKRTTLKVMGQQLLEKQRLAKKTALKQKQASFLKQGDQLKRIKHRAGETKEYEVLRVLRGGRVKLCPMGKPLFEFVTYETNILKKYNIYRAGQLYFSATP